MGATLVSSNTTLKVNRAITGATTVNSNSYAIVDYKCTSFGTWGSLNSNAIPPFISEHRTRYFGPAQSIPGTYTETIVYAIATGTPTTTTITFTLQSGVEFINTP